MCANGTNSNASVSKDLYLIESGDTIGGSGGGKGVEESSTFWSLARGTAGVLRVISVATKLTIKSAVSLSCQSINITLLTS